MVERRLGRRKKEPLTPSVDLTENSHAYNRFFASIGYPVITGHGAATAALEHDSSSHQNDTPTALTCPRKQVGAPFLVFLFSPFFGKKLDAAAANLYNKG